MSINNTPPKRGIVRWITYILSCIGVLILILGLIFPKEINVEVKSPISSSAQPIYNTVSNILNVDKWWPTLHENKSLTYTYSDMKFTTGATANFKSNETEGFIRIDKLDSAKLVSFTTSQLGKEGTLSLEFSSDGQKSNGTNVLWKKSAKLSYPRNAFGPFLKYRWKKELSQSALLLQNEIDHRIKDSMYYGYKIREATQNAKYFQTIRTSVSHDQFTLSYAQNIAAIYQKLSTEGITPIGNPCAIIYGYDETNGNIDMAAAIGVLAPLNIKDLTLESFPVHNAAYIPYFGDSKNNKTAHYALNDYISDRGYNADYPAIEEYVTDPLKEKDPAKWQTNIYYYFTDKK
jgi:effector-binding domain-containing protein